MDEIKIPKVWLEDLLKIATQVDNLQDTAREERIAMLFGYISSVRTLLKYK